jgi:hypothetical protein
MLIPGKPRQKIVHANRSMGRSGQQGNNFAHPQKWKARIGVTFRCAEATRNPYYPN